MHFHSTLLPFFIQITKMFNIIHQQPRIMRLKTKYLTFYMEFYQKKKRDTYTKHLTRTFLLYINNR